MAEAMKMILQKAERSDFDAIYRQMENNFIKEEIRDRADALAVLDEPAYALYHLVRGGERIGFLSIWHFDTIRFAEHFVIYEDHRNRGFGGEVIEAVVRDLGPIVLEAELPDTPLSARRIGFYCRHGFFQNEIPYRQPSYRCGGEGVPMVLLSSGAPLADPQGVVRLLYERVYGEKC